MPKAFLRVTSGADDANENAAGDVSTSGGSTFISDSVNEWFGFRFLGVHIPKDSTINSAILSVIPVNSTVDEPEHTFYGEDADNASGFTAGSANNDISGRTRTSASVLWDNADIGTDNAGVNRYSAPDLKTIVQEVVNRSGWVSGNALVLVAHGSADGARDLGIMDFDFSATRTPNLEIDYTPPSPSVAIDLTVGASADDAFESSAGVVSITSTPLGNVDDTNEWGGVRFANVTVPKGATVTQAILSFGIGNVTEAEPDHTFYGDDADNSGQFTTGANDISGRTRTTANVTWSEANLHYTTAGTPPTPMLYRSMPDIKTIIQEIVDRPGWVSGNALSIVFQGSADANRDLNIVSYDGTPSNAAYLSITYTAPPSGSGGTGGKGKGGGGKPPGGNQPPGKLKTFGTGRWHLGGRKLW